MGINQDNTLSKIKLLLSSNKVFLEQKMKIIDIQEIEYNEYCLTLESDKNKYEGFFIKTEEDLIIGKIINSCSITLLKKDTELRIYIVEKIINSDEEIIMNNDNNSYKRSYDLRPDNLINIFNTITNLNIQSKEEIFLISEYGEENTKLINPINLEFYSISSKYIDKNQEIKVNDFLYCKNYLLEKEKKQILFNKLTILKKANDYEIFNILEKNMVKKDSLLNFPLFSIIEEIKISTKIQINYLISKVILKKPQDKLIIIADSFNRLIKIDYETFKYLDLFDLLLIINCEIEKSKDNNYLYNIIFSKNTIKYTTKELFFDKRIFLNNFTILNIIFPDYNEEYNYYDTLNIAENEIKVIKKNVLCVVMFENEKYNEIVPYKIECKNKDNKNIFKFFIVNNIMFNINIFLNTKSDNNCCIEYCYSDYINDVPLTYKINIENNNYTIDHSNSFDSLNRIGFVLINIPKNDNINKIDNKDFNISSQIWYCSFKDKNEYSINQILNVNEAKPKIYYRYELNKPVFSIFNGFHKSFQKISTNWNKDKQIIIKYFEDFNKKVENNIKKEIDKIIFEENNIDYYPDSLDYHSFQTYINISLYSSLNKIQQKQINNSNNTFEEWKQFFDDYNNLVNKLYLLGNKLTYHQKIRILNSHILYYFDDKYNSSHIYKFFYIDEDNVSKKNSYYLALKFNRNIINRLTEKSLLTKGFLQLDGYILKNYFTKGEEVSYSLTNEPLILMKKHLLSNYENIVYIIYENPIGQLDRKASQDKKNNITLINEKTLFNINNSESLSGNDYALPISIEFFHEKDSYSKRNLKNFYADYKDDKIDILSKQEDDGFIESLIGEKNFILALKNPHNKLGDLMKEEYFIGENFDHLYNKYRELMENNKNNCEFSDRDKKEEKKKNIDNLVTLEDYENAYLFNGNFIYPDSLPFHHHYYGEEPEPLSDGEKAYLEKYKTIIEKAKKLHYDNY